MSNINNEPSEADYPNWNVEMIYLKYREKYRDCHKIHRKNN